MMASETLSLPTRLIAGQLQHFMVKPCHIPINRPKAGEGVTKDILPFLVVHSNRSVPLQLLT